MRRSTALLPALLCSVAAPCLTVGTAVAQDNPELIDACRPQGVAFTFTQPTNLSLNDQNAVRWPLNGTIRLGYTGAWCPEDGQVSFVELDGEGNEVGEVPAQVRMRMPYLLVQNDPEEPETVLEVDPVGLLKPRTDYRVTVSPPNPLTSLYRDYTLEFRTRSSQTEGVPDFEGITSVELPMPLCPVDSSPYREAAVPSAECVVGSRLGLTVRFTAAPQRPDLSYVVYRTSRQVIDPMTMEVVDSEYNTTEESPVRYVRSNVSGDPSKPVSALAVSVITHYGPLPRRECFSVRMADDYLRERGDLTTQACIDILRLGTCPPGCTPGELGWFSYPDPILSEITAPTPGQNCPNLGLAGADPNTPIPGIGEEPSLDPDAGMPEADMGIPLDGGAGNEGDGGGGSCATAPGRTGPVGLLLVLALGVLRRRR